MATYRSIAASEKDSDSPITATLIDALDQNATAIAEGALNAPKIEGPALDTVLVNQLSVTNDATDTATVTGLARVKLVGVHSYADISADTVGGETSTLTVSYRLSSDGGATWGSSTDSFTLETVSSSPERKASRMDIVSVGGFNAIEITITGTRTGASGADTVYGDVSVIALQGASP